MVTSHRDVPNVGGHGVAGKSERANERDRGSGGQGLGEAAARGALWVDQGSDWVRRRDQAGLGARVAMTVARRGTARMTLICGVQSGSPRLELVAAG